MFDTWLIWGVLSFVISRSLSFSLILETLYEWFSFNSSSYFWVSLDSSSSFFSSFFELGHISYSLHSSHFHPFALQIVCPNPTRFMLISPHISLGIQFSSYFRVYSGVLELTHSSQLQILWTCVSTAIAITLPNAV